MVKPAFQLRKATAADFSVFYQYYVHHCFHWLYHDTVATELDNPFNEKFEEDTQFFSKEDLKRIHDEIINFDIHDFEKYLEWYRIFMITVDNKIIGYVKMETYCKQFIIRGWTMVPLFLNMEDPTLLSAMLKKFETYAPKKAEVIQVVSHGKLAEKFLQDQGYSQRVACFFEKRIEKKSSN